MERSVNKCQLLTEAVIVVFSITSTVEKVLQAAPKEEEKNNQLKLPMERRNRENVFFLSLLS